MGKSHSASRVGAVVVCAAMWMASCGSPVASELDASAATATLGSGPVEGPWLCDPGLNVIEGTPGDDVLTGTNGRDCILGYGGNDIIDARGGRDLVFGGDGDDYILGGNAADRIWAGAGDDEVWGGTQDDLVYGGPGDDELHGEQGEDILHGDDGDDILVGEQGRDVLKGGSGCDIIDARNGPDTVYGGPGNDIIDGGHAPDYLGGGEGDDLIVAGGPPSWRVNGEAGIDACAGDNCELSPPTSGCDSGASCPAGELCIMPVGVCALPSYCGGGVPPTCGGDAGPGCDDGNPCTADTCVEPDGCTHTPFADGVSCTDEDACNGLETCLAGACMPGEPPELDDGDLCTADSCDAMDGVLHTPIEPTGTPDLTCDALDDDCDGVIDEDYGDVPTTCGVGRCAASGVASCEAGVVVDTCTPGTASGDDSTCDGIDDDCDGSTDEGFTPTSTSCGAGPCGSTGATSCVSGSVVDSCAPGSPSGDDSTCDGIDDDCDGSLDESYASAPTTCGVGACGAAGATACAGGAVTDSCSPGPATGDDSTCDGADDDCDGSTDEAYAPTPTTCGVGVCQLG